MEIELGTRGVFSLPVILGIIASDGQTTFKFEVAGRTYILEPAPFSYWQRRADAAWKARMQLKGGEAR